MEGVGNLQTGWWPQLEFKPTLCRTCKNPACASHFVRTRLNAHCCSGLASTVQKAECHRGFNIRDLTVSGAVGALKQAERSLPREPGPALPKGGAFWGGPQVVREGIARAASQCQGCLSASTGLFLLLQPQPELCHEFQFSTFCTHPPPPRGQGLRTSVPQQGSIQQQQPRRAFHLIAPRQSLQFAAADGLEMPGLVGPG